MQKDRASFPNSVQPTSWRLAGRAIEHLAPSALQRAPRRPTRARFSWTRQAAKGQPWSLCRFSADTRARSTPVQRDRPVWPTGRLCQLVANEAERRRDMYPSASVGRISGDVGEVPPGDESCCECLRILIMPVSLALPSLTRQNPYIPTDGREVSLPSRLISWIMPGPTGLIHILS
jgi:hypothetical protein